MNKNSLLLSSLFFLFCSIFQSQLAYSQDDSLIPFFTKLTGFSDQKDKVVIPLKYENAGNFSDGLVWVATNSKYGYIDKNDHMIIFSKYDYAEDFENGFAKVGINGKYGLIDKTGKEIISIKYDDCKRFADGLAAVRVGRKWGFIDEAGLEKISPQFDRVDDFSEDLAGIEINGKWGFADKTGQVVIKPQFESVGQFSEGLAFGSSGNENQWSLLDKQGKEYSGVSMYVDNKPKFINGYALFTRSSGAPPLSVYILIDKTGTTVFEEHIQYMPPPEMNPNQEPQTEIVVDGLTSKGKSPEQIISSIWPIYSMKEPEKPELKKIKTETKIGFVNQKGKIVIQPIYDENYCERIGPNCFWVEKDGEIFLIEDGKSKDIQLQYEKNKFTTRYGDGAIAVTIDKKIGFVDKYGKIICEPKFEYVEPFSEGLAAIRSNNKVGYINENGDVVISPKFDESQAGKFSSGLATIIVDGFYGYIDKTGRTVIQPNFLTATPFYDDFALGTTRGKEFDETIDKQGKVISKFDKRFIRDFKDGLASSYDKELKKSGYINKNGDWVIKPIYSWASDFANGLALVEMNDDGIKKTGFIDTKGVFAFEPYLGHYWSDGFHDGLAIVKSKDGESLINKKGEVILNSNNLSDDLTFDQTGIIAMKSKSGLTKLFDKKGNLFFSYVYSEY